MNKEMMELLETKAKEKGVLNLHFFDGEIVEAKIFSVSHYNNDVTYEIISSNRSGEARTKGNNILAPLDELETVSLVDSKVE